MSLFKKIVSFFVAKPADAVVKSYKALAGFVIFAFKNKLIQVYMRKNYALHTLLLLITFAVALPVNAQKNYVEGYVLTSQRDTIRGFIDDKNWSKNPDVIRFKKDINATQVTEYKSTQLHSFYITPSNDYYISYIGKVDNSPISTNKLIEVTDDSDFLQKDHTAIDSLFLNVLSQGSVSLYFYKDRELKDHFFFQKGTGTITELIFQKYAKIQNDGQKFVRDVRQYRGQLRETMTDCEKLNSHILKATYTKQSLTNIVNDYNSCASVSQSTYKKATEKVKLRIGLLAGMSKTSFLQTYGKTKINYTDSYNPVLGMSFNLILPRNRTSWSIYADIFWKSFSTKAAKTSSNLFERTLEVNEAKTNVMVRYSFPTNGIRPFINAGASTSLLINAKGNILTYNDDDYKDFDKLMIGLQGGVGAAYKKYTLEVRYENTKSVFSGDITGTSEHNLYVLLSYLFN